MSPQRHFHEELDQLKARLVRMAGMAEEAVKTAVQSLLERDVAKARSVIERDTEIDELEVEVDDTAIHLLALQQPMARDLRFIAMAMKIGNDLERVGDHAVNIANNVTYLLEHAPLAVPPEIEEMVRLSSEMLKDALDAFMRGDSAQARSIGERDDRVDELHESMFRILLTHMMEDPRKISAAIDILLVSRNIERIADLATNIAEDVVFMIEGRSIKHRFEDRAGAADERREVTPE